MSTTAPAKPSPTLLQKIATPLTIVMFAISGLTGLLMFFEFRALPIKVLHEWLSVLFVIAAGLHIVRHWRSMLRLLKLWWVWVPVVVVVVGLGVIVWQNPERSEHVRHGHGPLPAESGLAPAAQAK